MFNTLLLLCVALLHQSCITALVVSGVRNHKKNKQIEQLITQAEASPMVFGECHIGNLSEEIEWSDMNSYLISHNYMILNKDTESRRARKYRYEVLKSVDFVSRDNFGSYYYKRLSGGQDVSKLRAGKLCYFHVERITEYLVTQNVLKPGIQDCYWSGDLINGYIHGTGQGIVIGSNAVISNGKKYYELAYFEGTFEYGVPISDIKCTNYNQYEYKQIKEKEPRYYTVENAARLNQEILDGFVNAYSKRQYLQYKESLSEVEKIVSNYRAYAEDVILKETIPDLGQDIVGHDKAVLGIAKYRKFTNTQKDRYDADYGHPLMYVSPERLKKRQTLIAFKTYEGIDTALVTKEYKSLLDKEKNSLIDRVDMTLMYMDLLDGLALTSSENEKLVQGYLGKAGVIGGGAHDAIISSDYWYKLLDAKEIATSLKGASTGELKTKYALAEKRIETWFNKIYEDAKEAIDVVESKRTKEINRFIGELLSGGGSSSSSSSSEPKLTNSCKLHLYFKDKTVVDNETIHVGYTSWSHTEWSGDFETDDDGYVTIRWPENYKKLNWLIVPFSVTHLHLRYELNDLELTNGGVYEICLDCNY